MKRWISICEAPLPFGKQPSLNTTFGFEVEFIAKASEFLEDFDYEDIPENHLCAEMGCDQEKFDYQFSKWVEKNPDDDVYDWINSIGVSQWWKDTYATNNFEYTLDGDDISKYSSWEQVVDSLQYYFFGREVEFTGDYEFTNDYSDWVITDDKSIIGSDINDHSIEIISPIFNDYSTFIKELKEIIGKIKNTDGLYTNKSTGLHINIGAPQTIDPLKLILFSGEEWMAKDWGRENNAYAVPVLPNMGDLPPNIEQASEIAKKFWENTHKKSWAVNLKNLYEKGYIEIRTAGGIDYENKIDKIINHVERYVQVIEISSNPSMYKKEYLKKLNILRNNNKPYGLTTKERIIYDWLQGTNLGSSSKNKILKDGKIDIKSETLFALLTHNRVKTPLIVQKILVSHVGEKELRTFAESRGISKEFSTMIKNIIGWDIPHEDI